MELAGQFFLCMPATTCRTSDGQEGVLLPLREPAPQAMFPDGLTAVWVGAQALQFQREHAAELRPGRGLRLSLNRFIASDRGLRARVISCELLPLPPSWQRSATDINHQPGAPA